MKSQKQLFLWSPIVLALIACLLPWVANPGIALTLNAYDLAEWASLTPAARSTNPALITSLLLRLPIVCTILIIVCTIKYRKWASIPVIIMGSVALLPPFEFFTGASGDPNYRQQFALAIITLLTGFLMMSKLGNRTTGWLLLGLPIVAFVSGLWGLLQTHDLMRQFNLPSNFGLGVLLMSVACLGLITIGFAGNQKRGNPGSINGLPR